MSTRGRSSLRNEGIPAERGCYLRTRVLVLRVDALARLCAPVSSGVWAAHLGSGPCARKSMWAVLRSCVFVTQLYLPMLTCAQRSQSC